MNRILVSPKAFAVAGYIHQWKSEHGTWPSQLHTDDVMAATGLAADTVYRAFVELQSLRALAHGPEVDGARAVIVYGPTWLWVALHQDSTTPGVAVR